MATLKAPFTYFGGKSSVAHIIWDYLGDVKHYIEPFFGSGAVLLNRPNFDPDRYIETVCDKDGFLANVWRALQHAPDEVAKWCDYPVNHADLSARKKRLIENEKYLLENLIKDDEWYDAKLAGYWIWAASCWIGSGLTRARVGQIPNIANGGHGVHALGQRIEFDENVKDVREPYNTNIYKWFRELSERLRYVRVVCGDWTRVCGGNWQDKMGTVGIYFDPPYGVEHRDKNIYHHDSLSVAKEVEDWCLKRGAIKSYRIICSGYEGEYEKLLSAGWKKIKWTARGGYANVGNGQSRKNRKLEILVISPFCQEVSLKLF